MSLFLCHPPIIRPAACGRSRRTSSSSGSSARRGGLEEARLVNLARQSSVFPVLWQAIPVMIRLQRGCWATSRRRSSRRALQVCVSCTCFSCCVCKSMCVRTRKKTFSLRLVAIVTCKSFVKLGYGAKNESNHLA